MPWLFEIAPDQQYPKSKKHITKRNRLTWSLILLPSISTVFILKSIPMVDMNEDEKESSTNRKRIHVFPTPESPISISLKRWSYVFFAISIYKKMRYKMPNTSPLQNPSEATLIQTPTSWTFKTKDKRCLFLGAANDLYLIFKIHRDDPAHFNLFSASHINSLTAAVTSKKRCHHCSTVKTNLKFPPQVLKKLTEICYSITLN